MSQALPIPPAGFDALSVEDKIDYVQSLWDRIAARPEDVPVPEWHRQIITERLAARRADNDQGKD
jgi:putative addiction module component (TIGR02574 family)